MAAHDGCIEIDAIGGWSCGSACTTSVNCVDMSNVTQSSITCQAASGRVTLVEVQVHSVMRAACVRL